MPLRLVSRDSFFDPEFVAPACLQSGTVPWLLARMMKRWFPSWLFEDWRGHCGRGRNAWPAAVLMALVVLRWSEQGMSRRAAVARASTDVTWRAAMGLELGGKTPSEKTVRDFEKFLRQRHADTQVPRYLLVHEHIVRACLEADVARDGGRWVMDSTPMWCFGAVRDTVRLLGDGLCSLAMQWAQATRTSLGAVAVAWNAPFLLEKSTKGAFRIDWSNAQARSSVVTQLAELVVKAVELIRSAVNSDTVRRAFRKRLLRSCRHLLRVVEQDLEVEPDGRLVIAQRVAADRLISLTDPQARHGRKTKSQTFEGFKIHLLGDALSGLILSVAVTSGNMHDGEPAHRLLRRAKDLRADLQRVLADTAYGGARLRHIAQRHLGVTLVAPPPPVEDRSLKIRKADFTVDFERSTVTCPNNVTTDDLGWTWSSEHDTHVPTFVWPKAACDQCPLSASCRGDRNMRRLVLHPYEQELRRARETWTDTATRREYRTRSQGERLVNEVVRRGGRRARAFGLQAAQLQAHAIAMACNLRLLAMALAEPSSPQKRQAA